MELHTHALQIFWRYRAIVGSFPAFFPAGVQSSTTAAGLHDVSDAKQSSWTGSLNLQS
ncbi:hypothetical protein E8E14_014710 [Neopestalotiopsis sp. 37M]|nr:hypothetical protein E8E14_014710 [Neopestalotiopsis sp. 37M]